MIRSKGIRGLVISFAAGAALLAATNFASASLTLSQNNDQRPEASDQAAAAAPAKQADLHQDAPAQESREARTENAPGHDLTKLIGKRIRAFSHGWRIGR